MTPAEAKKILNSLYQQALAAVDPLLIVPQHLPPPPTQGRTVVLGAGKAAARMALAVEKNWSGPLEGLVVTRYGHNEPCQKIKVIEAGHPVPDAAGMEAAKTMLQLAQTLGPDDLVLALISGGGSSLLTLPAHGLTLEHKREINKGLLNSGASISEMNCVRRHLSAIKGGKLAEACGLARIHTLVISDVPGDDPAVVASGPTIADSSTAQDALTILKRYQIQVPAAVAQVLQTQGPSTDSVARVQGPRSQCVIATAQQALNAAARQATELGLTPLVLGGSIEGESRDVAAMHAGIARQIKMYSQPVGRPCVILSGGETTVTVSGQGRGGRNAEFMLSLALNLHALDGVYALAIDTDGIDGIEDNAGARIAPDTLARAAERGMKPRDYLANNDAYHFFEALSDLIVTGPTRTNVNDFRAILIA